MSRGTFDSLLHSPIYSEAKKDWYVELASCTLVWLDSIIDPLDGFDVAVRSGPKKSDSSLGGNSALYSTGIDRIKKGAET